MTPNPLQQNDMIPPTGFIDSSTSFSLDISGMGISAKSLVSLLTPKAAGSLSPLEAAHEEMKRLESGAIKNPDEGRRVTHFTDRLEYLQSTLYRDVEEFAEKIRSGQLLLAGGTVEFIIINGIGGSALGPQFLQFALNGPYWNEFDRSTRRGNPRIYFLDNTDSAGLADVKAVVDLSRSLVVTISKSGNTLETANNMQALEQAFASAKLNFAKHAIAVTMSGSKLDRHARKNHWLANFPMAESIGGRTSETNIVGHVPAAFTGINFGRFVAGAKHMDELTRAPNLEQNPAYQLAATWHIAGNGRGDRNMVIVPYSDRLVLLGRYLQQLVMESLGKELDLDGNVVHQGLTVYGNKGGTDAHAYIQQLNDGRDDFFITFLEILEDSEQINLEDSMTMGDHLHAFKEGLIQALRGKNRKVIEITLKSLDAFALGMLIALYERAVAVYAEFIHINAFHQPGVQAYKLASKEINQISQKLQQWIAATTELPWHGNAAAASTAAGCPGKGREVEGILSKFAVNQRRFGKTSVARQFEQGKWLFTLA